MAITSGTASSGTTVTFSVNANANSLAANTYNVTIAFTSGTGQSIQRTASLIVNPPGQQVAPTTAIVASGMQGGPFSPSSFSYTLSIASGSVKYSITNVPSWLTASPASGTLATKATSVTFRINTTAADKLAASTYVSSINSNNTTNSLGNTTRVATLTVAPKHTPSRSAPRPEETARSAAAARSWEASSQTVTATPNGTHSFVHWTQSGRVVSTSSSYTFTMPSANVTLVADFH